MIVTPLSDRATAVRSALLSHGWEGDLAGLTAGGSSTASFHVTGIRADVVEAMVPLAARLGLELITGDDWLILSGGRARLGAFARPWVQPEAVRDLATALGMAMPPDLEQRWQHARGTLDITGPLIVGVINMTPDSFSDGGATQSTEQAIARAGTLFDDGAVIVDVGGESTGPKARPVPVSEEQQRVLPVIEALTRAFPDALFSIDTVHAETARAAADAGVAIINDVTAGRHDPAILVVARGTRTGLVLSHSRGALGQLASYGAADYQDDVTSGVVAELSASVVAATAAGIAADAIVIDPGFGFSKTAAQSLMVLQQLDAVVALGRPVMVGVSRKRFLGAATGQGVGDRERATAAACVLAYERGARLFRVHEPATVRDALALAHAVAGATS